MHILIVNDDGPPSQVSSPYVHSFVDELQKAGHIVSVVLPHAQRSWIGKAHLVGKTVTPTYFRPGTLHTDDGTVHSRPRQDGGEEWILVDGTPASCAQIGIHHYFKEKGPIDLVVSGPNYGRNSTALFALSSGTIGGAMEAAVCGKRAIALSYAFHNRNHDPVIIKGASRVSVRIVEHLHQNWAEGVDLFSVNVPLIEGIDGSDTKILYTNMLQNYWSSGSSFEPVDAEDDLGPEESEAQIREQGEPGDEGEKKGIRHLKFKWAPKFQDVYGSVETSEPGNDGWAVWKGHVSITPLKANFMHAADSLIGQEVKLNTTTSSLEESTQALSLESPVYAVVDYEDAYVEPRILAALRKYIPGIQISRSATDVPSDPSIKTIHWSAYEKIPFESLMQRPENLLSCAYIIRKALIRKHHLALTARHHIAKHPDSILSSAIPTTNDFELDFAEFLDEALQESYELSESLEANEHLPPQDRKWWILKPGMSDRGQGIRLFSTMEELRGIFESWEVDSDAEEEEEEEDGGEGEEEDGDGVMTSQLRHFVAQSYIHPPLLVSGRKFHIRTYVLAVGGLRVYVYKQMLALFAETPYSPPWTDPQDLARHLTNTCRQSSGERRVGGGGSVRLFWEEALQEEIGRGVGDRVWRDICGIVKEVFEAAARGMRVHFQTLPNAFELFGVDFMVSETGTTTSLLEVNAYPDFKQTGEELSKVIEGLLEDTVKAAVVPFLTGKKQQPEKEGTEGDLEKVLDISVGAF